MTNSTSLVGPVEQEVLEPGERSLSELAIVINREHDAVLQAGVSLLSHAILAGETLLKAREKCPEGEWLQWLDNNTAIVDSTANVYMRLAHHRDALYSAGIETLRDARGYIRGLSGAYRPGGGGRIYPKELRIEAQRLHASKVSVAEISRLLDVSRGAIACWLDPEYAKKVHQRNRQRKRRKTEQATQARERTIQRAARKKGGALAEIYTTTTKLDQMFGQAREEATDKDQRLAINAAHALRDKMMDQIIRALGVS